MPQDDLALKATFQQRLDARAAELRAQQAQRKQPPSGMNINQQRAIAQAAEAQAVQSGALSPVQGGAPAPVINEYGALVNYRMDPRAAQILHGVAQDPAFMAAHSDFVPPAGVVPQPLRPPPAQAVQQASPFGAQQQMQWLQDYATLQRQRMEQYFPARQERIARHVQEQTGLLQDYVQQQETLLNNHLQQMNNRAMQLETVGLQTLAEYQRHYLQSLRELRRLATPDPTVPESVKHALALTQQQLEKNVANIDSEMARRGIYHSTIATDRLTGAKTGMINEQTRILNRWLDQQHQQMLQASFRLAELQAQGARDMSRLYGEAMTRPLTLLTETEQRAHALRSALAQQVQQEQARISTAAFDAGGRLEHQHFTAMGQLDRALLQGRLNIAQAATQAELQAMDNALRAEQQRIENLLNLENLTMDQQRLQLDTWRHLETERNNLAQEAISRNRLIQDRVQHDERLAQADVHHIERLQNEVQTAQIRAISPGRTAAQEALDQVRLEEALLRLDIAKEDAYIRQTAPVLSQRYAVNSTVARLIASIKYNQLPDAAVRAEVQGMLDRHPPLITPQEADLALRILLPLPRPPQ